MRIAPNNGPYNFIFFMQEIPVPILAHKIPKYSKGSLMFRAPNFYEVDSLLVEDWSEGIGLSVEMEGGTHELKRCSSPGKIILRDDCSIQLIESESVCELMTQLVVDSINDKCLMLQKLRYIEDVFKDESRADFLCP